METKATTKPKPAVGGSSLWDHKMVLLPYIVGIVALLPLLLYYFSVLWGRPHYQFFPLSLLMVGVFAYARWPKNLAEPFFSSVFSTILFWTGVLFGVAAAMFSESWFAAASMVALLTSLFARTRDGEVAGKTLAVLGLPLLIILMPPNNLDSTIITTLQQASAKVSSWYLDVLNFKHYSPGTTLNFPHHQYEVEQACSGVQSFFTLLFCTSFLIISLRRPFWRSLMLLFSAGVWAVFMNSVRILTIPIADIVFGVDLSHGLPHDLLGYTAMIIAILMILSTDQLLEFLFGRSSETVDDERHKNFLQRVFSRKKSGSSGEDRKFKPVSPAMQKFALAGSILVLLLGSFQFYDFARSIGQSDRKIRAFSADVIIDLDKNAMPTQIRSTNEENTEYVWSQHEYNRSDRSRGSDFGQRSDGWTYRSRSGLFALASLDQTFPGWHELTTCYKNAGWQVNPGARLKKSAKIELENGEVIDWDYIEVEMVNPTTSQRSLLLFSFCDADGNPFDPPIEWGNLRSFYERAKNRLFHGLRAALFRGEAYQMQVFVIAQGAIQQVHKEEIRNQYLETRKAMRSALLRYGDGGDLTAAPPEETPPESAEGQSESTN